MLNSSGARFLDAPGYYFLLSKDFYFFFFFNVTLRIVHLLEWLGPWPSISNAPYDIGSISSYCKERMAIVASGI